MACALSRTLCEAVRLLPRLGHRFLARWEGGISMTRRHFVKTVAAAAGATAANASLVLAQSATAPRKLAQPSTIKAVAFDALAIFDPRPVAALAAQLFLERDEELMA